MERDKAWDEAVRSVRGDAHGLVSVRDDLVERWSESHRGYHDLQHLDEVLRALAELRESALDSDVEWAQVVLAAWFHDAVYDIAPGAENERRSADLARTTLSAHAVGSARIADVVALVLASESHDVHETHGPQAAFHDGDLWILSAPEDRFDNYCAAVRREYAAVPDDAYAQGRTAILRPFLDRQSIYLTEHAQRWWEPSARRNLDRELTRLAVHD